ncbi:MAG: LacI family DNA-binding transcriptional regulator [Ginsengibacter sp.]
MRKAVTLKDIAKRLNMSISTVSKALNNDPSISGMTTERVKKLVAEWNYIPNEAARHFKLKRTFTIGLIIPTMLDEFYIPAINGAENIAVSEKYNVIILQSHEDPSNENKILELMMRNRVDGLIVAITKKTVDLSAFLKMQSAGIPVVFFVRPPNENIFDYVIVDSEGGAFTATEFLINKKHKRIGHLMGPPSLAISHLRLNGYKQALKKNKIKFDPELVIDVNLTEEATFSAMAKFMKMKNPPTAIFSFKNYINLDAIEFLKKNYPKKVGKIDFTGFGNLPLFRYLDHKPVASIEENPFQIGLEAAKLLIKKIDSGDTETVINSHPIIVPSQLIIHK